MGIKKVNKKFQVGLIFPFFGTRHFSALLFSTLVIFWHYRKNVFSTLSLQSSGLDLDFKWSKRGWFPNGPGFDWDLIWNPDKW